MSLIGLSTTIPMSKEESKYNFDETKLAPEEEGPFELKVGEVMLRVKFKYAQGDLVVYVTNDSSVKTLKCVVESHVMAHKVGKKLIHAKNLSISPKALIAWKIQEQKFFARHCLSKRQQRNEEVVRFIVKIFLEIKSWSVEEVKETVLDSSFSKASFAAAEATSATEEPIDFDVVPLQLHLTDKGAILQEGQAAALSALQRKENKKFQEVECLIFNRRLGPVSLGTKDIDEDWIWQLDFDSIIKRLGLSKLDSQLDNLVFLRRKGERKNYFDSPNEATDSN